MNKLNQIISSVLLAGIAVFASQASAITRTVDCDKGQSIQDALEKGQSNAEPLVINVSGTCNEIVEIQRDDVTIDGNNNAVISGNVGLRGADHITIANITITSSGVGLALEGSNHVRLFNTTVTGNQGWAAIVVNESSSLKTWDSYITNNSQTGVFVGLSSSLVTSNTHFSNNGSDGVTLALNSSAFLTNGTLIQGNATDGIIVKEHSIVDLVDTNISNNTMHGIVIAEDGGAILREGNVISGNGSAGLFCSDNESSYLNKGSVITDPIVCSDFN